MLYRCYMTEAKSYPGDAAAALPPLLPEGTTAPRCACGHELNHQEVLPEPTYSGWGSLLFLIGVTAKPLSVLYRCWRCKQVLAVTRDPKVLARFD